MTSAITTEEDGIQFASIEGKRSSQTAGRNIFGAAAASVDGSLADRITRQGDWRKSYVGFVRELVEAGTRSGKDALRIASEGLHAVSQAVVFHRDGVDLPLAEAFKEHRGEIFHTATVVGHGQRENELSIPYRGELLSGEHLERQLTDWETRGIIEPSCGSAIRLVLAHPEWLDVSDVHLLMLGAASEMGPLASLSRWGANIIAVDLPRPELWTRIIGIAQEGSGRLHLPIRGQIPDDAQAYAGVAGADLLTDTPEIRTWVESFDVPFAAGNYAYADGSKFTLLAAGADALIASFLEARPGRSLAYLATPTDVFAVPNAVVEGSHRAQQASAPLRRFAGRFGGSRLFAPNYRSVIEGDDGKVWGISDCLVPQQGPNYAAAKMLQRWRATCARDAGSLTSANIAPATRTRSVVKNKVLATAYRGADAYGVEIFESETSRALMAALLVHDLRNPSALSRPTSILDHPYSLFADGAAHGGLWRSAYEPRTVLPMAVVRGLFKKA